MKVLSNLRKGNISSAIYTTQNYLVIWLKLIYDVQKINQINLYRLHQDFYPLQKDC